MSGAQGLYGKGKQLNDLGNGKGTTDGSGTDPSTGDQGTAAQGRAAKGKRKPKGKTNTSFNGFSRNGKNLAAIGDRSGLADGRTRLKSPILALKNRLDGYEGAMQGANLPIYRKSGGKPDAAHHLGSKLQVALDAFRGKVYHTTGKARTDASAWMLANKRTQIRGLQGLRLTQAKLSGGKNDINTLLDQWLAQANALNITNEESQGLDATAHLVAFEQCILAFDTALGPAITASQAAKTSFATVTTSISQIQGGKIVLGTATCKNDVPSTYHNQSVQSFLDAGGKVSARYSRQMTFSLSKVGGGKNAFRQSVDDQLGSSAGAIALYTELKHAKMIGTFPDMCPSHWGVITNFFTNYLIKSPHTYSKQFEGMVHAYVDRYYDAFMAAKLPAVTKS